MAYTWAFSAGVKRELTPTMAASIDYVGNRGKANTAVIDINEGPINPATGRVTRLGVNVFDPNGELVPPEARGATFVQFNQNQTTELGSALDSDVQLARGRAREAACRTAGRAASATRCRTATTWPRSSSTAIPRLDYGRCDRDNVHAFATSAYVDIGKGFGGGIVFRAYSGYPINETVGTDVNSDGTNNDRPMKGVNDIAPLPSGLPGTIVSAVDSTRRRRPQRHRRREAGAPRRAVPIHRPASAGIRPGCSSRSTTC